MIGWVFFRADTLASAVLFLKAMAGLHAAAPAALPVQWYLTPELWLALVAGAIGSTPWVPTLAARLERDGGAVLAATSLASTVTLGVLLIAAIMQMAARTYNPFIYFRF
jgi:alginate O-acetyltransferase complex protein AlgI